MKASLRQSEQPSKFAGAKKHNARRWKLVERSFSFAAILVVLFLGWSTLDGLQRLFSQDPMPVSSREKGSEPENQLNGLASALADGGYWQMANWRWEVGITQVSADEIDNRLGELANSPVLSELADHEAEAISQLMFALHHLPVTRIERNGRNEYRIDEPGGKLRVVSKGSGQDEVLLSIGAAMRNPRSVDWTLFELRSKCRTTVGPQQASFIEHLLPLPPETNRLCSRTNAQGQVLFELVASPNSISNLVSRLSKDGWDVKPFQPLRSGETQLQKFAHADSRKSYLCESNNDLIHVWEIPNHKFSGHQLAMVRIQ